MSFREWEDAIEGYMLSKGAKRRPQAMTLNDFDHLAHLPEFTRSIQA